MTTRIQAQAKIYTESSQKLTVNFKKGSSHTTLKHMKQKNKNFFMSFNTIFILIKPFMYYVPLKVKM